MNILIMWYKQKLKDVNAGKKCARRYCKYTWHKAFVNRQFLCKVLSDYLNTDYKKEAKLLIRVAKAGYVSNIAKSNKVKNKEIINRQLHEDESIDKKIVEQLVDSLFDVINHAKIREANIVDEISKNAIIAEQKEGE